VAVDCLSRSKTSLGSTSEWGETAGFDYWYSGYPNENIVTYNWNRFYLIYCDGTGHQGYVKDPIPVEDSKIYIRGTNNTVASLNFVLSMLPP
jgi:hypothetical protein